MATMYRFAIGTIEVCAAIEPSCDPDTSWDESGETARKLDSGEWEAFDTCVSVSLRGVVIGTAWLCESIYANPADFFTDHRDPDPFNRNCTIMRAAWRGEGNPDAPVSICHYFPDLVREAVSDARAWLRGARAAA